MTLVTRVTRIARPPARAIGARTGPAARTVPGNPAFSPRWRVGTPPASTAPEAGMDDDDVDESAELRALAGLAGNLPPAGWLRRRDRR
jgi:hypothetical protein